MSVEKKSLDEKYVDKNVVDKKCVDENAVVVSLLYAGLAKKPGHFWQIKRFREKCCQRKLLYKFLFQRKLFVEIFFVEKNEIDKKNCREF